MRAKGLVLCGGKGKRLRPLTFYFQKTMIPVGSRQKPLLEYIVRLMRYHGIHDIALLVDYKAEQVENYFGDGSRFGVRIQYVRDNPAFPGNAGALYNAYLLGVLDGFDEGLIYYGDILSNINLSNLLSFHRERGGEATIALSKNYRVSVGVAEVQNSKVVGIKEKPVLDRYVVMGILVLNVENIPLVKKIIKEKGSADIMGDLIPALLQSGARVNAYLSSAFWYDVGSLEKYEKLHDDEVDRIFSFLF